MSSMVLQQNARSSATIFLPFGVLALNVDGEMNTEHVGVGVMEYVRDTL